MGPNTMDRSDQNLIKAIEAAKEYLLAGDGPDDAIRDAAEEHGLKPNLLEARLPLALGMEPAKWQTKAIAKREADQAKIAARESADQRADEKAILEKLQKLDGSERALKKWAKWAIELGKWWK